MIKEFIKSICPPILIREYRRYKRKDGFFGNYKTWTEAGRKCTGYDSSVILEKVKFATLKVKNGEAIFERDSVLFNRPEYNYALLTSLLHISSIFENKLRIVDFGGALGSTYYQCRRFLSSLKYIEWSIIEQKHFIECGNQCIEEEQLDFFFNIDECLNQHRKDVLLLSSVIQYMDDPYAFMENLLAYKFSYIIIDRTPLFSQSDRITVQKVSPEIYEASYPAYFLNKEKFIGAITDTYEIIAEWDSLDKVELDGNPIRYMGMLLRKKEGVK